MVVGRSKNVGAPMSNLLTAHNSTVTLCHSKTHNLSDVVSMFPLANIYIYIY